MPDVKLVYFDIRGLAEPIRWMLKIAGQPFTDERIPLDIWSKEKQLKNKRRVSKDTNGSTSTLEEPTGSRDNETRRTSDTEKSAEKRRYSEIEKQVNLKSWVGQLPILYMDDFQLSQVHSVIRFIAKKYGFDGNDAMQVAQAEEALELIYDLRLCAVAYNDCFKSETPDFIRHTVFRDFKNEPNHPKKEFMRRQVVETHIPNYFTRFALMIERNKGKFICGERMTYADLALANCIDVIEDLIDADCVKNFPNLKALKEDIFAIPQIKEVREARKVEDQNNEYASVG